MVDQAADLRAQAEEIRRDLRGGQIAELATMIERLRRENQALQERIAQLEAQPARSKDGGTTPAESPEAYRRQTEETWAAIKAAARGEGPPAPAAPGPPAQAGQPRLVPPAAPQGEAPAPRPGERELLEQILRTLQRIEHKVGS
jgi:hypothetical protein